MEIVRRHCNDQPVELRLAIEESLLGSSVIHITEALSIVIERLAEKGLLSSNDIDSMLSSDFDIVEE